MNKIYRKVFNARRGTLVAVDELKTGHSQAGSAGEGLAGTVKKAGVAAAAAAALVLAGSAGASQFTLNAQGEHYGVDDEHPSGGLAPSQDIIYARTGDFIFERRSFFWLTFEGQRLEVLAPVSFQFYDQASLDVGKVNTLGTWVLNSSNMSLNGPFNMNGGTLSWGGQGTIADMNVNAGTVTLAGGSATVTDWSQAGGTTTQQAGAFTFTNLDITDGTYEYAGGSLTADSITVNGENAVLKLSAADSSQFSAPVSMTNGTVEVSAGTYSLGLQPTKGRIAVTGEGSLNLTEAVTAGAETTLVNDGNELNFNAGLTLAGGSLTVGTTSTTTIADTFVMTGGTLSSDGWVTISAENAQISGGELTLNGSSQFKNMTVTEGIVTVGSSLTSASGDLTMTGGTLKGNGTVSAGDVSINADVTLADAVGVSASGTLTADGAQGALGNISGDLIDLKNGAQLTAGDVAGGMNVVAGTSLSGKKLTIANGQTANVGGTLVMESVDAASEGAIVNTGAVTIKDLSGASNMAYTQKGTSATLTSETGWFSNSDIRLEDGASMNMADYGQTTLGQGNRFVVENTGWSGNIIPNDNSQISADAFDGMSTLTVGQLTGDSTVVIGQGGLVKTGSIDLGGTKTVTLAGGAIFTSLQGVFYDVTSENILINASSPADTVVVDSDYLGTTDLGEMKAGMTSGIDWQSGTIAFNDNAVSLSAIAQAQRAIGAAAGENASNVAVVFTGNVIDAASGGFDIDLLETLKVEQAGKENSAYLNPGVILSGTKLDNKKGGTAADGLIFGTSAAENAHTIDLSIGVKSISSVEDVVIERDHTLALIGTAHQADGWSITKLLSDSAEGGSVTVNAEGKLQLGTPGLTYRTMGSVKTLVNNGTVAVQNGEYGATGTTSNEGVIEVGANGVYHTKDLAMNAGSVVVTSGGEFVLDTDGTTNAGTASTFEAQTGGKLTFDRNETAVGTIKVNDGANAVFKNLTVADTADVTLGGTVKGDKLVIAEGNTGANIHITGNNTWKGIEDRQGTVFTIEEGAQFTFDTNIYDYFEIESNFTNKGTLVADKPIIHFCGTTVNEGNATYGIVGTAGEGTYLNKAGAVAVGEEFRANRAVNEGTETWKKLNVLDTYTIAAGGITNVTGEGSLIKIYDPSASVRVEGELNAADATATITNGGKLDVADGGQSFIGSVTLTEGTITVSASDDTATALGGTTLNIDGGRLDATDGVTTHFDIVNQTGGTVENAASSTGDRGFIVRASHDISGGSFINTGNYHHSVGVAVVTTISDTGAFENRAGAEAFFKNLALEGGSYANAGTESGTTLTVSDGDWTNTGSASWTDATFAGGNVVNNGTLNVETITVSDNLTGTGSIVGSGAASKATVESGATFKQASADVKSFTNKGNTTLGTVSNFGSDKTYTHSGNAYLTIEDGSWFSGTNLVYTDGANVHLNEFGDNRVTVRGPNGPTIEDPESTKATFGGMTKVEVERLTSETELTIGAGGYVKANVIELDQTDTAQLLGGVLITSLNQLFEGLVYEQMDVEVTDPNTGERVTQTVDKGVSSMTGMKASVASGLHLTSGWVGLSDPSMSSDALAQAISLIKTQAGDVNRNNINIIYNGQLFNQETGGMSPGQIQDIIDQTRPEEGGQGGSIIMGDTSLDLSDVEPDPGTGTTEVTIGSKDQQTGSTVIDGNVGFKDVTGADKVTVDDGYSGTLIGQEKTEESNVFDDENLLVKPGTGSGTGGDVATNEGGEFNFGTDANENASVGWVENVQNEGTTNVTNGDYGIKGDLSGNGDTNISESGSLTTGGIVMGDVDTAAGETGGTITNKGDLTVVDNSSGTGSTNIGAGNEFINDGTYNAQGTDTNVAGSVTTGDGGESNYGDLNIKGGSNKVAAGGTESGDAQNITEGGSTVIAEGGQSTWDSVNISGTEEKPSSAENSGTADWDNVNVGSGGTLTNTETGRINTDTTEVAGSVDNAGTITGTGDSSKITVTDGGEIANSGTVENVDVVVDNGGSVTNSGIVNAKEDGTSTIEGEYTTAEGGETHYGDAEIKNGGSNTVAQGGSETGGRLDVSAGGSQTVEEGATSTWDDVTIAGTDEAHQGAASNAGDANWDKITVGDNGSLDNSGTITTDNTTVAGSVTNSGSIVGSGESSSVTVEDGGSIATSGSVSNVDIEVAEGGEIVNTGTITAKDGSTTVVDGSITTGAGGTTEYEDVALSGSNTVAQGGTETGGKLDITTGGSQQVEAGGSSTWDEVVLAGTPENPSSASNAGNADWDKVTAGENTSVSNSGSLKTDTIVAEGGSVTNEAGGTITGKTDSSSIEVSAGGEFTNAGTIENIDVNVGTGGSVNTSGTVTDIDIDVANGGSLEISGGTVEGGTLTAEAGSSIDLTGGSTAFDAELGDKITIGNGAEHTVTENEGDVPNSVWNDVTVAGDSSVKGDASWDKVQIETGGSVDVSGSLETNDATVSGDLSTGETGSITGKGDDAKITVDADGTITNAGSISDIAIDVAGGYVESSGSIENTDIALSENGTLTITDGTMTGGSISGTDGTSVDIQGGSVAVDSESGDKLTIGSDASHTVTETEGDTANSTWKDVTVAGDSTIEGNADWDKANIQAGGSVDVGGVLVTDDTTVSGELNVAEGGVLGGKTDASKVTVDADGTLTNEGTITDIAINIEGGSVESSGQIVDSDISLSDSGTLGITGGTVTGGTLTGEDGTAVNVSGGSVAFDKEQGDKLTVGAGAEHETSAGTLEGEKTSEWNTVDIAGDSTIEGLATWKDVTVEESGSLAVNENLYTENLVAKGDVTIGAEGSIAQLDQPGGSDTTITVENTGSLINNGGVTGVDIVVNDSTVTNNNSFSQVDVTLNGDSKLVIGTEGQSTAQGTQMQGSVTGGSSSSIDINIGIFNDAGSTAGTVTIAEDGTHNVRGSSDFDAVTVAGDQTISGSLTVGTGTKVDDVFSEDSQYKVEMGGTAGTAVGGSADFTQAGNAVIEGSWVTSIGSVTKFDDVTVSGSVTNSGTETGDQIKVDGSYIVTAGGDSTYNHADIGGNVLVSGGADTTPAGSLELDSARITEGGYLNNSGNTSITLGTVDGGRIDNAGTMTGANLDVNSGTVDNGPDGVIRVGTVTADGGTITNSGTIAKVDDNSSLIVNEGTVYNTETGTITSNVTVNGPGGLTNEGQIDNKLTSVEDGGVLTNMGGIASETVRVADGGTIIGGDLGTAQGGSITADHVFVDAGGKLVQNTIDSSDVQNRGEIYLSDVSNFGSDDHYVQTGANADINVENGWFENTNLTFAGGTKIDLGEKTDDGSLGANKVVITGSGSADWVEHPDSDPNYSNNLVTSGMTEVIVDVLKSETDLTVEDGGKLIAGEIDFDGVTADSTTLSGGVIITGIDQLFDDVNWETGTIEGVEGDVVFGADAVGSLKDSISTGLAIESGILGIKSEVELGAVADVVNGIRNAMTGSVSDVEIVFGGVYISDGDNASTDHIQNIIDQITDPDTGDAPDITLGDTTLDVTDKPADPETGKIDVVIGEGNGQQPNIDGNVGVKDVTGADSVTVEDGYKGTLVGGDKTEGGDVFDADNSLIKPGDGTGDTGGDLNVNEGGEFNLGTDGRENASTGWVENINNDGTTNVTNGDFGVKGDISGNGDTNISDSGSLTTGGIVMDDVDTEAGETGGTITNKGDLNVIDNGSGTGSTNIGSGNEFVNEGNFDANGTDTNVGGSVTTGQGGNSNYGDMNVSGPDGSNTVASGGIETGDKIDVSEGSTTVEEGGTSNWNDVAISGSEENQGSAENSGTANWDNINVGDNGTLTNNESGVINTDVTEVTGSVDNAGTISGTTDDSKIVVGEGGTVDNTGTIENVDVEVGQGGSVTNSGTVNAKDEGTSKIEGEYTTADGGETNYGNAEISNGGSNTVASGGSESGSSLDITQGGSTTVEEGGTSSWDDVAISGSEGQPGSAENAGTANWDNVNVGDNGTLTNNEFGVINTDVTEVTGSVDNAGTISGTTDDSKIVVGEGGTVDNTGTIENIDVEVGQGGSVTNAGTVDNADVNVAGGKVTNKGTMTDTNVKVSDGGVFTVESGSVTGGILNAEGGRFDLTGGSASFDFETGTALNVGGNATYTVKNGSSSSWQEAVISGNANILGNAEWMNAVISEGANLKSSGSVKGNTFTQTGGSAVFEGGSLIFKDLSQSAGSVVIGNTAPVSADNTVLAHFTNSASVGGNVRVIGNGKFVVGTETDFDDRIGASSVEGANAKAVIGSTVSVAEGGKLLIGSDVTVGGSEGLVFGSDSVTIIDVEKLGAETAFQGSGTSTVKVEEGAKLILGNVTEAGTFTIVKDFSTIELVRSMAMGDSGSLISSWLDEDHLYALNDDGTGLNWVLDLGWNNSSVWVNATLADVRTEYGNMVISENANALLKTCGSEAGDAMLVCGILKNKNLSKEDKSRILNSVAQIGAAGAVTASAFENMVSAVDAVEERVSFAGDTFTHDGRMVESPNGSNLWLTMLGKKHKSDNLGFAGGLSGGYKSDVYGFMMGFDKAVTDQVRVGTAFSYQDGSLDSLGSILGSTSDYTTYGLSAYISGAISDRLNLIGSLGWYWNEADVSMTIGQADFGSAKANVDSTMFSAAARVEGRFDVGAVSVIPHAGIRMLVTNNGDYTTTVDGREAFKTHEASRLTGQLPIGVTVRGDVKTTSGWDVAATADATVTPQFGDTNVNAKVSGVSSGAVDAYDAKFAGRFASSLKLGVKASKDNMTFGANVGTTMGTGGKSDTTIGVTAKFTF